MEIFHLNVKQVGTGLENRVVDEQSKLPWEIISAKILITHLWFQKKGAGHITWTSKGYV